MTPEELRKRQVHGILSSKSLIDFIDSLIINSMSSSAMRVSPTPSYKKKIVIFQNKNIENNCHLKQINVLSMKLTQYLLLNPQIRATFMYHPLLKLLKMVNSVFFQII